MAGELTNFFVMLQLWILVNVNVQACDSPCLYFSAGRVIKSFELSSKNITSSVTELLAHYSRVLAVAVDVEEETLYWSDQVNRTIKRIDLRSRKIEVVASEVGHCEGIAIDWVHKYIYWADNKNGRIEMSRVNGSDRKIIFDRDVQNPRGVAVDPVHGYMFWTDYGDNPKIERATLAGQERTAIITNGTTGTRLKYPNDVLVDYSSNKIYWVDAGLNVVGTADLEGHNIMISKPIENSHLFAVALYNNTLYISDTETNAKSIIVIDKGGLQEIRRFSSSVIGSRDLFGMAMLHESRQPPVISPCKHGNGGCSHLCFIVPDGYRCGCPNGTALREDGYSCQEANFTNCLAQPCQNGGTCYFNFQRFTDDCTCSKYYAEKDCGLYLGSGAVSVTLEMEVKEWEEEKFKQAITRGLEDYCMGDNCSLRNESISKQFCPSFLNTSAFSATQVAVIGQPVASLPNHTKVDFAVILRPVSSSKPLVVVNTTLEHIVWERANPISEHFNKIVLVNYIHPSSHRRCYVQPTKETPKSKNKAIAIALPIAASVVVILLVSVVVAVRWYRRRYNAERDDRELFPMAGLGDIQPRGNNEEGNNGGHEHIPMVGQRGNNEEENYGGYEAVGMAGQRDNQQRGNIEEGNNGRYESLLMAGQRNNNREGNDGGYEAVGIAGQRDHQQRGNSEEGNNGGHEHIPMAGQRGNNEEENYGGYEAVGMAGQRDNQQRGNIEEGNNGRYESLLMAGQRNNNREGNDGGYEAVGIAGQRDQQQRGNNEEGNNGRYESLLMAGQRNNNREGNGGGNNRERNDARCVSVPERSHRIVVDKDFTNTQASNRDIVDNQEREYLSRQRSAAGYVDMNVAHRLSMPQETSSGAMQSLNIPGNQQRENSNDQNCEVAYQNEVALENDKQQSEDMGASQTLAISQETLESATGRQPVENDDYGSGTYINAVQCTDADIKKNPH